ncbi:MAG: peptidoglycan-binding protein [Clostridia bacterium]|nr:peptidoglycan-binding protein [Clostridia bacterium]
MPDIAPVIPEFITVHLGAPNSNAQNVTVPFIDYIKNVASSEIYPTWPENALRANIYAQISFALNKIYTEYYRSRGYDFDITNTTQFDQAYVQGRTIFADISDIVDDIFDSYLRRNGAIEPLASQFCNGTTVTCEGLSQWGTVTLANDGYLPFQIIRYYYGDDVNIINNVPVESVGESYPGTPLRLGDVGPDVQQVQILLNAISTNYPAIPKVPTGAVYGESTENAVRTFQRIFNLTPDGIVGRATWYKLINLFTGINRLNELNARGDVIFGLSLEYPDALREGDTGQGVLTLQLMLNLLSEYYDTVPQVAQDGVYGPSTTSAVAAFQRAYGLPVDGIVGPLTWESMYNAIKGIYIATGRSSEFTTAPASVQFPGVPLSMGARGNAVMTLQNHINDVIPVFANIPTVNPTGNYGMNTRTAVSELQNRMNLPQNGTTDEETWNGIERMRSQVLRGSDAQFGQYPGYDLREGMQDEVRGIAISTDELTGRPIYSIQYMLRIINKDRELPGIPDGIFGPQTTERVVIFQTENNINPTGIVDVETFDAIKIAYDEDFFTDN